MKKVREKNHIAREREREAMRVYLAPQARCIYSDNDSHLD